MNKFIISLLLISNLAFGGITFANDPDNVALTVGEPAPFAGVLLPIPRAQRVELMSIDLSTTTQRLSLAQQDNSVLQQENTNLKTENTELRKEANDTHSFLKDLGTFMLGSLITTVIVFGVHKANQ